MESSRFMAILWTGFSDAAIAVYNAKYTYGFWRPVTAIRAGGTNSNLIADHRGRRCDPCRIIPSIRRRMGL